MQINSTLYPEGVKDIFLTFLLETTEIRLCGGAVRDLGVGVSPKDWDFCTPALPARVIEILRDAGYYPVDLSSGHGTITVTAAGTVLEITTLRIDETTDGRHATVKFTDDWKLDAARRDFTINAMSADSSGNVFDYFNGLTDLENRVISFVGFAPDRIVEDYLRILRYYRFAGRFNAMIPLSDTMMIDRMKDGLDKVSGERIWSEMQKILVGPNAEYVIYKMRESGVLGQIGVA